MIVADSTLERRATPYKAKSVPSRFASGHPTEKAFRGQSIFEWGVQNYTAPSPDNIIARVVIGVGTTFALIMAAKAKTMENFMVKLQYAQYRNAEPRQRRALECTERGVPAKMPCNPNGSEGVSLKRRNGAFLGEAL